MRSVSLNFPRGNRFSSPFLMLKVMQAACIGAGPVSFKALFSASIIVVLLIAWLINTHNYR